MNKTILDHAFDYAREKMEGLKDDEGFDAIGHPLQVSLLVQTVLPEDHNLICAALLHDLIEDAGVTYEEIKKEFNEDIADLVNEVTHEGSKDAKGYYFPRLKTQRGIVLKFADRLSNLSRMNAWPDERKAHYLSKSIFWEQLGSFGKLRILDKHIQFKSHDMLLCKCVCGNTKLIRYDHLISGATTSCGCHQKTRASESNKTHGMTETPTYITWANMKNRCLDLKDINYGGRGITFDERWVDFNNFLEDMGEKPENMSLDRINNDGNYSKDNCKWSNKLEQANNKRSNRILEFRGEKKTMMQWANELGIKYQTIYLRLKSGKSIEEALLNE